MNVQIQSVKFDADKRLVEFVNAKMAKLDRFAERSTGAEVILKLVAGHTGLHAQQHRRAPGDLREGPSPRKGRQMINFYKL